MDQNQTNATADTGTAAATETAANMPEAAIAAATAAANGPASAALAGLAGDLGTADLSTSLAALVSGGSANTAAASIAGIATAAAAHVVNTTTQKQGDYLSDRINSLITNAESRVASLAGNVERTIDHTPILTAIVDFLAARFPHDVGAMRSLLDDAAGVTPPPPAATDSIPVRRIGN